MINASRSIPVVVGLLLLSPHLGRTQQATQERTEFDVASIRLNHSGRAGSDPFTPAHGALAARNVSLLRLVEAEYGVPGPRIIGGPPWLNSDRFDVEAKGRADATEKEVWLMLQTLLGERFGLLLHSETRELPIYFLENGTTTARLLRKEERACDGAHAPITCGQLE